MINAAELRLGNLFINPEGNTEQFEGYYNGLINPKISHHYQEEEGYREEEIEPIAIDIDWLERMGFEHYHTNPRMEVFYFNKQGYYPVHINRARGGQYFYGEELILRHVHQLQNLFFALTGDELIIS